MKKIVKKFLSLFGFMIVKKHNSIYLSRLDPLSKIMLKVPELTRHRLGKLLSASKSQIGQDFVALITSNFKHSGFFVEFGATNGLDLNNTFILEKKFDWTGILVEPAESWLPKLRKNRSCVVDSRCVTNLSGESLDFMEVQNQENLNYAVELSSLVDFANNGDWASNIRQGIIYKVKTISLLDLLIEYNAPKYIDFLSIDTEGSEFLILRDFDFSTYNFGLISVEHNYTDNRRKVFNLLTGKGYYQIWKDISEFDDWYVSYEIYLDLIQRKIYVN